MWAARQLGAEQEKKTAPCLFDVQLLIETSSDLINLYCNI
jgi:hypothetical protein